MKDKKMIFEKPQKVLFRHCDPAGIIFYPRYFEMVNDLVEAFFAEALDWPFEELLRTGGVPTAEIRLRFAAPSRHGDRLTLMLEVTRLGRASMVLNFRASADTTGELRIEGASVLVHVDATGKPTAWPTPIRTRISTEMDKIS